MSSFLFLQSLMSPFADGTSPTRLLFVVLFVVIVLGVSVVVRRLSISRNILTSAFIGGMSAVGLIALLTLLMHIGVFHHLHIPQFTNATFMTSDEITNTRLIHNHFGKIVVGVFMPLAPEYIERLADTGSALVPLISPWLVLLVVLLVLFALISFGVVHAVRHERSLAWSTLYLLLTAVLMQNLLDGGILGQNTLLAGALLIVLLFASPKNHLRYSVISFALYALGAFAIWVGGSMEKRSHMSALLARESYSY